MNNIKINKATAADIERLRQIGKQTFVETFAEFNTPENMNHYLENSFSEQRVREELDNPDSDFYFAEMDNQAIGYLKINRAGSQTESGKDKSLEIERIYVLKEFHGSKVGHLLLDKAMKIAKEEGVSYVWLGVWEQNPRAIRFYEKNGFVPFDTHVFILGDDRQTDILMKKPI